MGMLLSALAGIRPACCALCAVLREQVRCLLHLTVASAVGFGLFVSGSPSAQLL
jgi:hypothetical protein